MDFSGFLMDNREPLIVLSVGESKEALASSEYITFEILFVVVLALKLALDSARFLHGGLIFKFRSGVEGFLNMLVWLGTNTSTYCIIIGLSAKVRQVVT